MKTYRINEIFYSLQGEGMRAGTPNVFIRFAGCNMKCDIEPGPLSPGGFACDTEFESGTKMSMHTIIKEVLRLIPPDPLDHHWKGWVILTGGEPALQIDDEFIMCLHNVGMKVAIETNGTMPLPVNIDWVTLSPKVAEHALKVLTCHELKYVRGSGQGIPKPKAMAKHYLISPAFEGGQPDPRALSWCIDLVRANPQWRLSMQMHKAWRVR